MAELDWHALIDATQLSVSVDNGTVTVAGTVPSIAEKLVVLDTVESVDGVHDVISQIDVKVPAESGRTDAALDSVIRQLLAWDALVPEQDLEHWVSDGWVTLRGSVPTARQRSEAERVVAHLLGVRGVTNEIELRGPDLEPAVVREAIVRALERHARHEAGHIDVVVEGNRVTLSGSVETPAEKRAVIGAVSHAPGVEALCADLVVRPGLAARTGLIG
jgi:hyperosmotically inducible protein